MITVELYGIPRERVGKSHAQVVGETLGDVLGDLGVRFPSFASECLTDAGALRPEFIANINGDRFTRERAVPLVDGSRVLILSADAGG